MPALERHATVVADTAGTTANGAGSDGFQQLANNLGTLKCLRLRASSLALAAAWLRITQAWLLCKTDCHAELACQVMMQLPS